MIRGVECVVVGPPEPMCEQQLVRDPEAMNNTPVHMGSLTPCSPLWQPSDRRSKV